jgi:hypothetical protein
MRIIDNTSKVFVSRDDIAAFNRQWPCSELRSSRAYWFEFDADGDLVDTDCPEQDDGSAASAVASDCREFFLHGTLPDWAIEDEVIDSSNCDRGEPDLI